MLARARAGTFIHVHYLKTSNRIIHFIPQIRLTLHPNTLMAIFSLLHRRVQELKMVGTYWSHRVFIHTEVPFRSGPEGSP